MNQRTSLIAAAILLLAGAAITLAQPPGGGMGGPRGMDREKMEAARKQMEAMRALSVDAMWGALSFGVALPEERLDSLRPAFQSTWNRRREILSQGNDRDWGAVKDEFSHMRKELEKEIEKVLGEEELKAYRAVMQELEKAQPKMPAPQ